MAYKLYRENIFFLLFKICSLNDFYYFGNYVILRDDEGKRSR